MLRVTVTLENIVGGKVRKTLTKRFKSLDEAGVFIRTAEIANTKRQLKAALFPFEMKRKWFDVANSL